MPVTSPENALLQQQKPTSTQTSQQQQQQLSSSGLIQAGTSQSSSNSQQSQEQNYFNAASEAQQQQQHSENSQPTVASVSANSPVQMPQNGYSVNINSNANVQQTQSYTQQQCIGAQGQHWTARGSNTLTYTSSMQPPEHQRAMNQTYCEIKFLFFKTFG